MVQFQKRVKHRQQKWYHFRKGSKIVNENGTILVKKDQKFSTKIVPFQKKGQNSSTKMVPFQSEKGQNSLTKNVPFQKRVKIPKQKWYNFRRGSNIVNKIGTILVRKGSKLLSKMVPKFLNKKWYHFRKGSKFLNKNSIISVRKGQGQKSPIK